jgi:predicted metal-binding membrane protein
MPVSKLLEAVAILTAGVVAVIAAIGLVHTLATTQDAHMLIHELESWAATVAFHLVLTLLAVAGVYYLNRKK